MRGRGKEAWCLAAALLLSGCFGLSQPTPKIRQYRLDYTATSPSGPPLPYVLRVPPMEVAANYDREPIVYRETDYSIGSYFYFRWASNPGNMIADLLARDFAASGLYRDVQTAVSVVPPDFQVKGTVEEIEERVNGRFNCSSHLSVRITLAAARGPRDERVRFTKLYTYDETTRCDDPRSIAESMSRAMAAISGEIQTDVYGVLKTSQPLRTQTSADER